MKKETESIYNCEIDKFDPILFGVTNWQTLMTNWWYNFGRGFVNDPIKMSYYWYNTYLENLKDVFPIMFQNNSTNKII